MCSGTPTSISWKIAETCQACKHCLSSHTRQEWNIPATTNPSHMLKLCHARALHETAACCAKLLTSGMLLHRPRLLQRIWQISTRWIVQGIRQ